MSQKYKNGFKRLLKIDELLRSHRRGGISVREIAKITTTSVRTIQRDLLYLQSEFEAPVCKDGNNYFYTSNWSLTDIAYTHEDMAALALANSVLSSLFAGTSLARVATDRLRGILEHCARMELMENEGTFGSNFCRDEIQVAFPANTSWKGSKKFLDAILEKKCSVVKRIDSNEEFTMRPLRIIFAWSSCYILYITSDYKTNKDFKIEFPSNLNFVREANKAETKRVPDILKDVSTFAGLNLSYSTIIYDTATDGEVLKIQFEGKADYFVLYYRKNTDGTLSFVENEITKDSGHLWERITPMLDYSPEIPLFDEQTLPEKTKDVSKMVEDRVS